MEARLSDPAGAAHAPRIRWGRGALAVAAWLLVGGVAWQAYLAGRAAFVGPGWWLRHRDFVHMFEGLSPLAVILAYVARSSRATKGLAWLTIALLLVQYVTAGLRETAGRQGLAALHAVGAALLLWNAVELARTATREARGTSVR